MAEEILPLLGIRFDPNDDDSSSDSNSVEDDEEPEMLEEDEGTERKDRNRERTTSERSISFDSTLPSSHTYLGTDMEEISGRTILEDGAELSMPLITLPGTILVPGHIIPLYSLNQHEVAMLKTVVDSPDKTFGVVALRRVGYRHVVAGIGTTAEIYSMKNEMDDATGIATITVLAQGRQRFELKDYRRTITGNLMGTVKILPEVELTDMLKGARSPGHCRLCCHGDDDGEEDVKVAVDRQGKIISCVRMKQRARINRFSAAHYTWWPPWVYKMYDKELLVQRVKTALHKWNDSLNADKMPNDATTLSYWVTQNLPLDDSLKLHLLSINSTEQRLRCALNVISKCSVLCCKECGQHIADMDQVFSLSIQGPLGAYVNPGGHVHETLTLHTAQNLTLIGRSSTEHSWFPGYAWTIAQCSNCSYHMGWKFTTKNKELMPQKFWGLCRSSMVPGISNPDGEEGEETEWRPVM